MSTQARPEQRDDAGAKSPGKGARAALGWLTMAIVFGAALGYYAGARTAVRPALDAATMDRAESGGAAAYARLLDELRNLRAEMEQIRHEGETAQAANDQNERDLAARLARLEARMARIDSIDMTPTGSIAKERAGPERPALYNRRARP